MTKGPLKAASQGCGARRGDRFRKEVTLCLVVYRGGSFDEQPTGCWLRGQFFSNGSTEARQTATILNPNEWRTGRSPFFGRFSFFGPIGAFGPPARGPSFWRRIDPLRQPIRYRRQVRFRPRKCDVNSID